MEVNQQPSVSNRQIPLMGFNPQWRGASSFKAKCTRVNETDRQTDCFLSFLQIEWVRLHSRRIVPQSKFANYIFKQVKLKRKIC